MKIIICLIGAAALLSVAGCAQTPLRSQNAGQSLGNYSPVHDWTPTAPNDYRRVLADPGPF